MNKVWNVFVFYFAAMIVLGSLATFFLYTDDPNFFVDDVVDDNITHEYPPWESQAAVFDNLETENGDLQINYSSGTERGQYISVPLNGTDERLTTWQVFEYQYERNEGQGGIDEMNITIETSDTATFDSIKDSRSFTASAGIQSVDLSSFQDSTYLRFTLDMVADDTNPPEMENVTITGQTSYDPSNSSDMFISAMVLVILAIVVMLFAGAIVAAAR